MKRFILLAALASSFGMVGCASSLEQIVDEHHMARIDAANANRPLARGAADGLGSYITQNLDEEVTTAK